MSGLFDTTESALPDIGVAGSADAIVVECEQLEAAWLEARIGRITASYADCLVTSQGKPASSAKRTTYLNGLVAERLVGTVEMHTDSAAMERGRLLEPEARDWYAMTADADVREVGFVYRDAGRECGCSPDGLCTHNGLEIKCPMRRQMIACVRYMLKHEDRIPAQYVPQVQFSMWVCGLPQWDFVVYTPEPQIPSLWRTVHADAAIHVVLDDVVPKACEEVKAAVELVESIRKDGE